MYKQPINRHSGQERRENNHINSKQWIDAVDLELIFMNSIAICIILLAIVAVDVFM